MKPDRRYKFTPEIKVKIVTDYRAGMPIKQIKARYKISDTTIYAILKEQV